MLNVETYICESSNHGLGLFAQRDIKKDEIVWTFNSKIDHSYSVEEWLDLQRTLSPPSFSALQNFAYKEKERYYVCSDNAQFMNHHSTNYNVKNSDDLNSMHALKNINKGEELLYNYFESSDKDDYHVRMLT